MPIDQTGSIVRGTRRNLLDGLRSKPLAADAVAGVMEQAASLTEQLVTSYSTDVAAGEVGSGGNARASDAPIIGPRPPRALMYGRIQSGKTVAMILTAALALDNGFRVVVVLTTDNVALVRQTASRFKNLDGPRVFSAAKDGDSYEWEGQEEQLRAAVMSDGLVLVCAKNSVNLPEVIRFLQQVEASSYPVLVMDDEADAATPDTTIAARSAGKPSAPALASRIHRLVFENDDPLQLGFSLGEVLPHSLYLQVTATPYVLLLQRSNNQIRPTVPFLLNPGQGYCGGDVFFGSYDTESQADPFPGRIVVVADNEAALMSRRVPSGLAKSIDFFIISACARSKVAGWPSSGEGFKHLSHTSHRINDHDVVANHISTHLNDLRTIVQSNPGALPEYFAAAYRELQRSIDPGPLEELIDIASSALRQTEVIRINSKGDMSDYGPRLNFVVGGNILGRGLTIDDLLVTYYIREAKVSQMDTVWQHARMFGYRESYLSYIRIFLPYRLGLRFKQIHESEELQRNALINGDKDRPLLIFVPTASRPTRPNALEAGVVRTVGAQRDQIFPYHLQKEPDAAAIILKLLTQNNVPIGKEERDSRATPVPYDVAVELVRNVPTAEDDEGLWQEDLVLAFLDTYKDIKQNGCVVYVRQITGDSPEKGWSRGRLNGTEITLIRQAAGRVPGLALLYRGEPDAPTAWYPTLVMPPDTPLIVFSAV